MDIAIKRCHCAAGEKCQQVEKLKFYFQFFFNLIIIIELNIIIDVMAFQFPFQ